MNVMIDSDVYLIDIRYQQDKKFSDKKRFLSLISAGKINAFTSIYNLLEICGILSFNLNRSNLEKVFASFATTYDTTILFPAQSSEQFLQIDLDAIWDIIIRKVAFLDSLIISVFEETIQTNFLISWNAKHFQNKTKGIVLTPKEFTDKHFPVSTKKKKSGKNNP